MGLTAGNHTETRNASQGYKADWCWVASCMVPGEAVALAGMLLVTATMNAAEPEDAGQAPGDRQGLVSSSRVAVDAPQPRVLCPSNSAAPLPNTVSASRQDPQVEKPANQAGLVSTSRPAAKLPAAKGTKDASGQTDTPPKDKVKRPQPPTGLHIVGGH